MSTPENWAEDARIERARLERRPDPQTGFSAEDEFWCDEPEDEELQENEE